MFLKNGAKVILIYVLAKKVHSIYHRDKKSKKPLQSCSYLFTFVTNRAI